MPNAAANTDHTAFNTRLTWDNTTIGNDGFPMCYRLLWQAAYVHACTGRRAIRQVEGGISCVNARLASKRGIDVTNISPVTIIFASLQFYVRQWREGVSLCKRSLASL